MLTPCNKLFLWLRCFDTWRAMIIFNLISKLRYHGYDMCDKLVYALGIVGRVWQRRGSCFVFVYQLVHFVWNEPRKVVVVFLPVV